MFDKVVFAGGGHRCWWQAGFWEVLRAEIELRPRVIGAVSMGAFMACLVHANDTRRALAWYERELAGVRSNMAWVNLFRKDEPLFRQGGIYRKAMRALLGGEHFRQLMWQAPEIRVACAVAPAALSDRQLDRLGWREARRDARLVPASLHAKPERAEIFVPLVKRLQDCRTEREMCDLLQASSAYPPLVPAVEFEGERVVTGELVDPVPVDLVADVPGQTLVLTTRTYNRKTPVFAMEGRIYVQPSAPVPVASWDFTSARRFQQTYELGRQDAEAFLKLFGLGAFRTDVQFGGAMLAGGQWGDEARVDTVMDDDGGAGAGSAGAGSAGSGSAGSGRGGGSGRAAGAGGTAGADGASGTAGAAGVPGVDGGVDDAAAGAGDGTARARDGKAARDTNRAGFDRDGVAEGGAAEGAAVAGVGAAGAGIAGASGEQTGAGAGARDARSARADASQADGAGTRGPGRAEAGSGQVAGGARGDGGVRRDGAGRSAEADRTGGSGAGRGSMAADDRAAAGSASTDDRRRVGIGSAPDGRMSAGGGRDAIPADADGDLIDDTPLTLTDGHTLGEPSDKLFERAGRLPPRSANGGGRKEDGQRAGDGKRRGEGARGDSGGDDGRGDGGRGDGGRGDDGRGDDGRGDTGRGVGARKAEHARKRGRKTEK